MTKEEWKHALESLSRLEERYKQIPPWKLGTIVFADNHVKAGK